MSTAFGLAQPTGSSGKRRQRWLGTDPALLASDYQRHLVVDPVELPDDRTLIAWVAFLRDCVSHGVSVTWDCPTLAPIEELELWHLPPPASSGRWAGQYRFGQLYYRRGPGFVVVRDGRAPGDAFNITVDGDHALSAFAELERVVDISAASAPVCELLALLQPERLVAVAGSWATILPYRMRTWPVPSTAI